MYIHITVSVFEAPVVVHYPLQRRVVNLERLVVFGLRLQHLGKRLSVPAEIDGLAESEAN